ncbi:Fic family protein [Bradyrhizobium elkanii]|uniref:Fic family protein n=1 Tax=Bradyrhizobium elkanii TaxID=29448 RepID=A0A8I1YHC4_BRAEL|nr:Fic family protein [Bradyrhizobium elkanii]MBP1296418.1 Fic family protein [Bradyrhizobium elkanii]
MAEYIYQLPDWPHFSWESDALAKRLAAVRLRQGELIGRMHGLGFPEQEEAVLTSLTEEVLKSSEIEGEKLDKEAVRSSLARRLGMETGALPPADRNVEGIVEMMLDATQNFKAELTAERLFGWHASLFPTGRSNMKKIAVGAWRDTSAGPMQVISGDYGRERVHYEAPAAERLDSEMTAFLKWYNTEDTIDPIIKAAIAHLWFVTIHPFEDGNGRIARAIADMSLARSEEIPQRFYSMSAQIRAERNAYYDLLESTQKRGLNITPWLEWFLGCLDRAIGGAETVLAAVLEKAEFWKRHAGAKLNDRQRDMLNRLLDGFDGKLTSSKWAAIEKCSPDTALRDIQALVDQNILARDRGGGRSTSYTLVSSWEL